MTTGEKIRTIRLHFQLTQTEMAEQISTHAGQKVSRDRVAKWETDVNEFPWPVAVAYCTIADVTLDNLIRSYYVIREKGNKLIVKKSGIKDLVGL